MTARIPYDSWAAIDQAEARRMARDPEINPLWLRVMFASIGWANLIGHSSFAPGGLAIVLQSNDPKEGGLSVPSASHVANAIATAKAKGLIGRSSDSKCLVSPGWWLKSGGTGGKSCAHHKIRAPRRHTQSFTESVNQGAANLTESVKRLHGISEPLSVNRPISDSDLQTATQADPVRCLGGPPSDDSRSQNREGADFSFSGSVETPAVKTYPPEVDARGDSRYA